MQPALGPSSASSTEGLQCGAHESFKYPTRMGPGTSLLCRPQSKFKRDICNPHVCHTHAVTHVSLLTQTDADQECTQKSPQNDILQELSASYTGLDRTEKIREYISVSTCVCTWVMKPINNPTVSVTIEIQLDGMSLNWKRNKNITDRFAYLKFHQSWRHRKTHSGGECETKKHKTHWLNSLHSVNRRIGKFFILHRPIYTRKHTIQTHTHGTDTQANGTHTHIHAEAHGRHTPTQCFQNDLEANCLVDSKLAGHKRSLVSRDPESTAGICLRDSLALFASGNFNSQPPVNAPTAPVIAPNTPIVELAYV